MMTTSSRILAGIVGGLLLAAVGPGMAATAAGDPCAELMGAPLVHVVTPVEGSGHLTVRAAPDHNSEAVGVLEVGESYPASELYSCADGWFPGHLAVEAGPGLRGYVPNGAVAVTGILSGVFDVLVTVKDGARAYGPEASAYAERSELEAGRPYSAVSASVAGPSTLVTSGRFTAVDAGCGAVKWVDAADVTVVPGGVGNGLPMGHGVCEAAAPAGPGADADAAVGEVPVAVPDTAAGPELGGYLASGILAGAAVLGLLLGRVCRARVALGANGVALVLAGAAALLLPEGASVLALAVLAVLGLIAGVRLAKAGVGRVAGSRRGRDEGGSGAEGEVDEEVDHRARLRGEHAEDAAERGREREGRG